MRLPLASIVMVFAAAMPARAGRDGLTSARAELMRLHVKLTRAAMSDPALLDARNAANRACADLYQVRQNAVAELTRTPDYADIRLALWSKQKQLEGLYIEVPMRVQTIVVGARDALSIRAKLTQLESAALEANPAFIEARDKANAKLAAYAKAQRDALDAIRSDPSLAAASQRVQAMQRSITGYRGPSVAALQ